MVNIYTYYENKLAFDKASEELLRDHQSHSVKSGGSWTKRALLAASVILTLAFCGQVRGVALTAVLSAVFTLVSVAWIWDRFTSRCQRFLSALQGKPLSQQDIETLRLEAHSIT